MMKKATIFAAMLAMVLVLAVPAFARNDQRNDNDFEVSQHNEQEVESGDAAQNINVSGGGDNSNQCAGVQGIDNTGNATSNTSVLQFAKEEDTEVELDDSGNFEISPTSTTSCDQQVNQAASASG
jgi:hypothetical protein